MDKRTALFSGSESLQRSIATRSGAKDQAFNLGHQALSPEMARDLLKMQGNRGKTTRNARNMGFKEAKIEVKSSGTSTKRLCFSSRFRFPGLGTLRKVIVSRR